MKVRNQALRLRQAIELLHRNGTRMMLMHSRDGDEFYIVPGGRLDARDAVKILERPDIKSFDDGLFPATRSNGGSADELGPWVNVLP